ncbi:hypothetical protein [Pelorhabdus rhamnosifermentans]|uniref:hypothetical protein n=1 Tax=Pelorhabdus rhamnosifermentans TaxID=2772457 RepID=UPI001C05F6B9|nr:hypothetical protein [Pelorhabdus rhamnosifermentans]
MIFNNRGGIPVIAHPGDNLRNNMDMIDNIIKEGIRGIEVFSGYHTPDQVAYFQNKAEKNKLIITCGSDFHGKNKPHIQLGDCKCIFAETYLIDRLKEAVTIKL